MRKPVSSLDLSSQVKRTLLPLEAALRFDGAGMETVVVALAVFENAESPAVLVARTR
jgi:hypothetical protein